MNKMKLRFLVFIFLAIIIQLFVLPFFVIDKVQPDIITITVIYSAFYLGRLNGSIFGFISGLLFDVVSGGMIGSSMFAKTLVGFIAGFFQSSFFNESEFHFIKYLLIILFCSSVDAFFFSLFGIADIKLTLINLFFTASIFPGLYTTILSIPFYFLRPKGLLNE